MQSPDKETHPEKTDTQANLDLSALLETSKILNSSSDLDFILSHILRTIMGKFMLTRACVVTVGGSGSIEAGFKYKVETQRGMQNTPDCFNSLDAFCQTQGIHLLVSISSDRKQIGYIGLGKKFSGSNLSESEKSFIESLAALAASAIENALVLKEIRETNQQLNRKVQQLKTLFELSNEYRVDLERTDIIKLLARSLSGQLVIKSYLVCSRQNGNIQIELEKGVKSESLSQEELQALFSFTFPKLLSEQTFPSLCSAGLKVAVPLRNDDRTLGLFLCTERLNKIPFSESDLEFMHLAAAQTANALEQARLFNETLEIRVLEAELEVAREIQQNLFPKEIPVHKNLDLAAGTHPSRQVGGDYYDLIQMDEAHLFIAIADASGKGTPASLLMSNLQAMIKAYMEFLRAGTLSLTDMMGKINNIIYENTSADKFISLFCGILNLEEKKLVSVNGGHNPPYILKKDGSIQELTKGGIILGVAPTFSAYESAQTQFEEGDLLFLFTDGVTEAMSAEHEQFGEARLLNLLKTHKDKPSRDIIDIINKAIMDFQPPGVQYDDLTSICIKVVG